MTSVSRLREQYSHESPVQAAARQAALRGAVSAFPTAPATHKHGQRSPVVNGALSAASFAGRAAAGSPQRPPAKPAHLSSASYGAVAAHRRSQEALELRTAPTLTPKHHNEAAGRDRSASPSNIAAILAAARHSPRPSRASAPANARPQPDASTAASCERARQGQEAQGQVPRGNVIDVKSWLHNLHGSEDKASNQDPDGLRERKNIGLYTSAQRERVPSLERVKDKHAVPSHKPVDEALGSQRSQPKIVSPQPIQPVLVSSSVEDAFSTQDSIPRLAVKSPSSSDPRKDTVTAGSALSQPRGAKDDFSKSLDGVNERAESGPASAKPAPPTHEHKPIAPPPRRSRPRMPGSTLSVETFSNASPAPPHAKPQTTESHRRASSPSPPPSPHRSTTSITTIPKRRSTPGTANPSPHLPPTVRKISAHMTSDSLANAIVASSLASSRARSPTKPRIPYRHHNTSAHSLHHLRHPHSTSFDRSPSPSKPYPYPSSTPTTMRQTMRHPRTSSDDETDTPRPHRKFLIRKTPHKHHEGDRARWRDEVTERERKRYEGLWAANRGLLIPMPETHSSQSDASAAAARDCVHGLVVRDIWRRSRLPDQVLEEVWALVDMASGEKAKARSCLGRAEFVVGLWLVDQRLKGRKLPVRVGGSVWRSVRGMKGVVVQRY